VLLPEKCSIKVDGSACQLAPTFVVSIDSEQGEYMMAVVCDDHKDVLQGKLALMQRDAKIPAGRIKFESVKTVTTDCVVGMNEDYVDIELSRGVKSDRKLT
jgi:hypothetical protein